MKLFWAVMIFMLAWLFFTERFIVTFVKSGPLDKLVINFTLGVVSFLVFVLLRVIESDRKKKIKKLAEK